MTHELKIEKQWADAKLAGEKPFELRRNDRGFQKGDLVKYTVVDPKTHEKMWFDFGDGRGKRCHALEKCEFEITYVREGSDNGLQPGYCVFADRPVMRVGKGISAADYSPPDHGTLPKTHYEANTPVPDDVPNKPDSDLQPGHFVSDDQTIQAGTITLNYTTTDGRMPVLPSSKPHASDREEEPK